MQKEQLQRRYEKTEERIQYLDWLKHIKVDLSTPLRYDSV